MIQLKNKPDNPVAQPQLTCVHTSRDRFITEGTNLSAAKARPRNLYRSRVTRASRTHFLLRRRRRRRPYRARADLYTRAVERGLENRRKVCNGQCAGVSGFEANTPSSGGIRTTRVVCYCLIEGLWFDCGRRG